MAVWVALNVKGVPYREVHINLQDKPDWYKEIVPTTLVPAVKFVSDERVVWESQDILDEIESRFPDAPLLPPEGSEQREHADVLIAKCPQVLQHGVRLSYPSANATAKDRSLAKLAFLTQLDELDALVAAAGGPFLSGASFTLADAMYAPMLERWAVQVRMSQRLTVLLPPSSPCAQQYL